MSKKILSIVILLMAVVLSGCAVIQEQGLNGATRTRVEILGPSMNVGYGMNRGYAPGGMYNPYANYPAPGNYGSYSVGPEGGYYDHAGKARNKTW